MNSKENNQETTDITWKNDNTPISTYYGDVYFSADSGIQESEYIFINNNFLPERFKIASDFSIGETGFGTGLNFALTCKLWAERSLESSTLFFTTYEKHPLSKNDFIKAAKIWPELSEIYSELIPKYKNLQPGKNRIKLDSFRTELIIIIGDINNTITKSPSNSCDCWFLDGFAPSLNPQMWNEHVLKNIARTARNGSTFSTFTAAGKVRRTLIECGYCVEKVKGFGKKRDMLRGDLSAKTF